MSARQRLVLVGLAAVVLVVAFVIAQGSGGKQADSPPPVAAILGTPTTVSTPSTLSTPSTAPPAAVPPAAVPTVVVSGGKPVGGVKKLRFAKGDQIAFRVRSDVADEIHVHGYDVKREVPKGATATFSFRGTIDGIFVVELEARAEQIASLEVTP